MPDLIRHPVSFWIPAFAGMTALGYLVAGVIPVFNFLHHHWFVDAFLTRSLP